MIYEFKENHHLKSSLIGGKAKLLIESKSEGFNVPYGFVLSVDFFYSWQKALKATSTWFEFLTSPTKENCEMLITIANELEFTLEQSDALEKALLKMPDDGYFAVRSSSPEEDLENISYAGMYETILGVSKKALKTSIKKIYASMLDYRVVQYKLLKGVSIQNPLMAVIIQTQIKSEISGVAFSINPQNNCYDEVVINASFGLGETIVSGTVTPDYYVVDKLKNIILTKKVMGKKRALWLSDDGGTEDALNRNPKEQALADEQIMMVNDLVKSCEIFYDKPVDVEWAICEGDLYLLQTRPITGYFKLFDEMCSKAGGNKSLYLDLIILTQGFSTSLSVLGLDLWKQLLIQLMRFPEGKDGILMYVNGRQYLNVSNMVKAQGIKSTIATMGNYDNPTKKIVESIDFEKGYLPDVKTKKMKKLFTDSMMMLMKALPTFMYSLINRKSTLVNYQNKSQEIVDYCQLQLIEEKNFGELVEDMMKSYGGIAKYAYTIIINIMLTQSKLNKLFEDEQVEDLLVMLNMDLPGNPTSEMGTLILRLASFQDLQNTNSREEFVRFFKSNRYSQEFYEVYDDYVKKFACRCFKEIDIATTRAYENPGAIFEALKQIDIHNNVIQSVKQRRLEAYNKLLHIAKKGGFEKKFVKVEKKYYAVMGYREVPKYIFVRIIDMLRKRVQVLGERFKAEGRILETIHIYELTINQLAEAEQNPKMDLLLLIEQSLKKRNAIKNVTNWPSVIDSRGEIYRYIRNQRAGELVGDPIAPGIVQGVAKVLLEPYEKSLLKGEILVTRSTEPSWTPIFINAAAIVLEIGGPLHHGAIIAREYGIPCVSGIEDATNVINGGDLIEVDGTSGKVKIINRAEQFQPNH